MLGADFKSRIFYYLQKLCDHNPGVANDNLAEIFRLSLLFERG